MMKKISIGSKSAKSASLMLLLAPLLGCGGDPALPPVTGIVTYEGKPVEGATVAFIHQTENAMATGTTDADGNFTLYTYQKGPGAVPGSHQVTVRKTSRKENVVPVTDAGAPPGAEADVSAMMQAALDQPAENPEDERDLLPEKYKETKYSGLQFEVTSDGPQQFQIDLK